MFNSIYYSCLSCVVVLLEILMVTCASVYYKTLVLVSVSCLINFISNFNVSIFQNFIEI